MLLPPTSSLPPKPLTHHSLPLFFFFSFSSPLSRTPVSQNPKPKPIKFTVRSSKSDSQTLLPTSAIQRISEKLRSLGFTDEAATPEPERTSAGEIFVPLPNRLPRQRVGHTIDASWSTPENPVPEPGSGTAIKRFRELKSQVRRQKLEERKESSEERVPTLAELTLPAEELRRLRTLGIGLRKKVKVGKAGITEGIVNGIHERWRRSEVVKIECEDICRMNMKRTHDLLERKTGGLVVWRSGSKIVLYRGMNYKYPYFYRGKDRSHARALLDPAAEDDEQNKLGTSSNIGGEEAVAPVPGKKLVQPNLRQGVGLPNRVRFELPGEAQMAEEADRLLDGLGPRFSDWWGYDPQPVDADLLRPIVRGYRRPFRLLPYGVQPKLTDDEMTTLRRLARPLPCHFALGRNRNLQGLASSIIKLWEKCEVAKIAIKRGVQNSNSEMMAEELKSLTGGTLLARDREFIVLYRGKDFLPTAVSSAIEERRNYVMHGKKLKTDHQTSVTTAQDELGGIASGANESIEVNGHKKGLPPEHRNLNFAETSVKRTSIKLSMAIEKRAKVEQLLAELEKAESRQQPEIDKEGITKEERYMLRKIGLRMKPFLLLGRRGVFDGTIENMHLHWKYRELVKVILANEKNIEAVHQVARTLEAESGGILVAVERVSKGYAIIVYRGKNYERPSSLRPQTLLTKKAAMKRSIEAQRRESLKLHVLKLTKNIDDLKLRLAKDKQANKMQPVAESSNLVNVRDVVSGIESAESLRLDAEIKSDSLSLLTTSHEEIVVSNEMNSSVALDAPHGVSDEAAMDSSAKSDQDGLEPSVPVMLNGTNSSAAVDAPLGVSEEEATYSSAISHKNGLEPSVPGMVDKEVNEMTARSLILSNRERLLLRKQALKMKKRPVLAVGRNNIVTGVAKTIMAHFQKHPLAIVNVKGRAKGTSVQEVVFMLEQATGAVLVSQEPSKVILYRGWGGEYSDHTGKKNTGDARRKLENQPVVSPELLDAIRTECGLQNQPREDSTP